MLYKIFTDRYNDQEGSRSISFQTVCFVFEGPETIKNIYFIFGNEPTPPQITQCSTALKLRSDWEALP